MFLQLLVFITLLTVAQGERQEDFYKVLGVSKDAKQKEIQRAFRREGAKWHPDRAPEGKKDEYHKRFSKLTEAYAVIGDAEKRREYDMQSAGGMRFGGGHGGQGGAFTFNFGDLFGNRAGARAPSGGEKRAGGGFGGLFEQMFGGGGGGVKFNSNFGAGFGSSGSRCVTTRTCDARGCRTETRCN